MIIHRKRQGLEILLEFSRSLILYFMVMTAFRGGCMIACVLKCACCFCVELDENETFINYRRASFREEIRFAVQLCCQICLECYCIYSSMHSSKPTHCFLLSSLIHRYFQPTLAKLEMENHFSNLSFGCSSPLKYPPKSKWTPSLPNSTKDPPNCPPMSFLSSTVFLRICIR